MIKRLDFLINSQIIFTYPTINFHLTTPRYFLLSSLKSGTAFLGDKIDGWELERLEGLTWFFAFGEASRVGKRTEKWRFDRRVGVGKNATGDCGGWEIASLEGGEPPEDGGSRWESASQVHRHGCYGFISSSIHSPVVFLGWPCKFVASNGFLPPMWRVI